MSDKIQSILPPTASPAERAVDVTGGELLAQTPVHLVRDVKNADACPVALLPWLAWERSVDTWNDDWTEAEKRAAIKRAPYIHRHRGTKAALTASLTDSPFRSQIIEWFEQEPPGKPYTFRLNVEQKDLPVLMSDHQDLKHAVLRAKNLRSWFSIHVYGRETGLEYAAGYLAATEILRARVMPSQIVLTPSTLSLAPGDTGTVQVTVLPSIAEDKSFTISVSDASVAAVSVEGTELRVTGRKAGACSLLVETVNGVRAELSIRVVAVAKFVVQFNDAARALFFVGENDRDFTIDYGDGVDCRDYVQDGVRVMTTREIPVGRELSLTVKNAEGVMFFSPGFTGNPLLEIIHVGGTRTSMAQFAKNQATLRKIHSGAFDELPEVTTFSGAFANCTGLNGLPDRLFATTVKVESFGEAFAYAGLQTLPPGMFAGLARASDFSRVFIRCPLVALPEGLFVDTAGQNFEDAFYGCSKLTALPDRLFDMHLSDTQRVRLVAAFQECTGLKTLPPGLFDTIMPNISSLYNTFSQCSSLVTLPPGVFTGTPNCTDFRQTFYLCVALTSDINAIFSGDYPSGGNLTNLFYRCSKLTGSKSAFLAKFPSPSSTANTFYGCSSLTV
ncbi:phage tail protein I [Salmonella enterica subsp. enterica]|nr:phage tail protein I [Salmonella enterica subsp. enterica]ELX2875584.1 phage tail protein I [Salmonella enterica]